MSSQMECFFKGEAAHFSPSAGLTKGMHSLGTSSDDGRGWHHRTDSLPPGISCRARRGTGWTSSFHLSIPR